MSQWQQIDDQLQAILAGHSRGVQLFQPPEFDRSSLASHLSDDLRSYFTANNGHLHELVNEFDSPISLVHRRDALEGYFHLMERDDFIDPVLQRAKIVSQLYFDLIYFRDRILILLNDVASQISGAEERFPYLMEWLGLVGENEFARKVRALRNGFAHGKWEYLPGYSGLACYPEKRSPYTRYEFSQEEIHLVHAFFYSFQLVFFSVILDGA